MKRAKLLERIEALEKRVEVLEKKATAGTAAESENEKEIIRNFENKVYLLIQEIRKVNDPLAYKLARRCGF